MKKEFVVAAMVSMAALLTAAELQVAVLTTPMTVDGRLDEYAYVGYGWSEPFVVFDRENAVTNGLMEPVGRPFCDLKTQGGVFTDATTLYIAVLAPCNERHPAGADDGVGVALSPDGRMVLVVECGSGGKCAVSRIGVDGVRTVVRVSSVRGSMRIAKRAFYAEIAIPYSVLGRTPDASGSVWKCNIYRTGPSCGGTSSWAPVQGDMFNTDRFGEIVFGKRKTVGAPLAENKDKAAFLWLGERWGGDSEAMPPLDERELERVSLLGPRGGRAVTHFRVSNLTDRPALYSLTMKDYAKNDFAKRVRFREVGNVELKGGPTVRDPIFDLPNGSVLRIPAKSTAMVWVDVDTKGMKPGLHAANLTFIPGYSKFEEKRLALELTVGAADVREIGMPCWNYALRNPGDLHALRDYMFNVSCVLRPWLAPNPGSDGRRDWSRLDAVVSTMIENGIPSNEVRLLCYDMFPIWSNPRDKPQQERVYIDNMRAGIAYAKRRWGIGLDRIWFSTVDEPHGDPDDPKSKASFAFYGAQLAKRIDSGLKSWTNPYKPSEARYLPRYLETFDTLTPFLPVINNEDPTTSERYAKSGKDIWSYTIYLKQNRPVQYRGISWKNFAYGFDGPAVFYDLFDMAGDGFNSYDKGGKADYGAVYSDRRTGLVTPSLRLEAWYQGHMEQRLLKWCKARIDAMPDRAKAKAFAVRLDSLVKRATVSRPDFDAISRDLLALSDEIECGIVTCFGKDGIVRVTSGSGRTEYTSVKFALPVKAEWRVLCREGSGVKAENAWRPVGDGRTIPWYAILTDGTNTYGFGVKVQPRAMCAWRVRPNTIELLLDLRAGGQPLELGKRTIDACEVVRCESQPGESAYETGRRLCTLMCPSPRLPKDPLIGFNDWYAAYGRNTATNFLADAAFVVSLCRGAAVQPYVVMDDGWQKFSPPEVERTTGKFDSGYGPWEESSCSFGMDMKTFCAKIAALGAKPGLWYRPLCMEGKLCDPSDPAVLERIRADVGRFREWGFRFLKIDYLTYDWCGHFKGLDEGGRLIRDDRKWYDAKHTTAETIVKLYSTIRDAAGEDIVILGCNAVNHLCAGLFEASRVGPDTSGRNWEQTRRNGVGAVAFKGIENGTLFAADPDCAGLASEGAIPWEKNRMWIDLLSRSGMPFFISWRRTLADGEVRKALSDAFRRAARRNRTAEAIDWLETSVPHRWLTADGVREYTWE